MNHIKPLNLKLSASFLLLVVVSFFVFSCSEKQPNVIFILTDDQGYGDMACHGNPWIKTPNMDKLHSESLRFTNYHVGTTCSPTRAGLMSGMYCNKVGAWHTVSSHEMIHEKEVLLPKVFKDAGYATAIYGKWHLGDSYPHMPEDRGFEEVLIHGGGGITQSTDYWENDYFDDTYFHNGTPEKFEGYCTDIWFKNAIKFIEKNKDKPFFCYLSTNAPHSPFFVDKKYSDLYKENEDVVNADFYGMITNIDDNIGILRKKLEELQIADNTILVFMTDNGTSGGVKNNKDGFAIKGFNAGMRGSKGWPMEGGHRVPFFLHWKNGGFNEGTDMDIICSYTDFMPTILDLCGVEYKHVKNYDGISLKPYIGNNKNAYPERIVFTDTQRENELQKWKAHCIMTQKYRLVDNQLFDMDIDPGQRVDVSKEHPELVKKLKAAYETWWGETENYCTELNYLPIGSPEKEIQKLYSFDCIVDKGLPVWSQYGVRNASGQNGVIPINIVADGEYEFTLRRWPKEANLKIKEGIFHNKHEVGKKLDVSLAYLEIDGQRVEVNVDENDYLVKLKLKLKANKTLLKARFICDDGVEKDAYYITVKKAT